MCDSYERTSSVWTLQNQKHLWKKFFRMSLRKNFFRKLIRKNFFRMSHTSFLLLIRKNFFRMNLQVIIRKKFFRMHVNNSPTHTKEVLPYVLNLFRTCSYSTLHRISSNLNGVYPTTKIQLNTRWERELTSTEEVCASPTT